MSEELTKAEESKDRYFTTIAEIATQMTEDHGKDFAMGAFVLAARWIAEGKLGEEKAKTQPLMS